MHILFLACEFPSVTLREQSEGVLKQSA